MTTTLDRSPWGMLAACRDEGSQNRWQGSGKILADEGLI
jgi:hypothetical protein